MGAVPLLSNIRPNRSTAALRLELLYPAGRVAYVGMEIARVGLDFSASNVQKACDISTITRDLLRVLSIRIGQDAADSTIANAVLLIKMPFQIRARAPVVRTAGLDFCPLPS